MAMDGFTKDMNIIQQLNDEPNDRDGLTAGELKAKFDEGGLALKDYLNNTVKPYVEGMEETEAAHEDDTVRHITAAERTAWNGKYDKTGGVLTGNVTVRPNGTPQLALQAPEKDGVGRSRTTLYKNATDAADNGTTLVDYVWGDATSANQRTALILRSAAADLKDRLMLVDYAAGGSYVQYHLYGEHNPPGVGSVTGLQAALNGKSDTGHGHAISDVTDLQAALNGKAAASHTHSASDINSGTLNANRLPTVPISKGGTGQTDALAAITALGGLSAGDLGTPIASGDDIDSYLTPGTYWSEGGTISASLQGTPPWTGGGFKLFVVKSHTNRTFFHIAVGASAIGIRLRVKKNETTPWGDWVDLSTSVHTHGSIRSDGSIGQDTDPEAGDRLLIADASDGMAVKRGNIRLDGTTTDKALTPKGTWESFLKEHQDISGKADVNHTHPYLSLSGGTLTGNLVVRPAGSPNIALQAPEKAGVGRSRTSLYKNASATVDYGTMLIDYVWGDASTANQRTALRLQSAAADLADRLAIIDYAAGGTNNTYRLYGEHNKPYVTAGQMSGTTLGEKATAEGDDTISSGNSAHAEGYKTTASGNYGSHAEGYATVASGDFGSHAEGIGTVAAGNSQHVFGKYNVPDTTSIEIVGGGTGSAPSSQKNIRTLATNGNEWIAGTLTQASDARLKDIQGEVPDVSGIRAVRFKWNDVNGEHDDRDHIGYIAQEVEAVAPYLVGEDSNGYKSLDYIALLCAKVEMLERQVRELTEALSGK